MKKRKMDKVGYASTLVMAFVFIYLICEIVYKLLNSGFIGNVTWEVVLLVCIVLLFGLLTKDEIALNVPKSMLGEVLPLEKKMKKDRLNQYLLEGMVLSLLLCIINIAAYVFGDAESAILIFRLGQNFEVYDLILNTLIFFISGSIIFYGFEYYVCERNISLYTDFIKTITNQEKELRKELREPEKSKRGKK